MSAKDTARFVEETRREVAQALEMVRTRLSVDNPEETFSISHITGALVVVAMDEALKRGATPQKFIAALRGAADHLDAELQTQSGFFAQIKPSGE